MAVVYGSHSKSYYGLSCLPYTLSCPASMSTRAITSPASTTASATAHPFPQPESPDPDLWIRQSIVKLEHFLEEASDDTGTAETGLVLPGISPDMIWELKDVVDSASLEGVFSIAKRLKLNYDGDSETMFVSCPSLGHEITSQFPQRVTAIINENTDFFGSHKDDREFKIYSAGSTPVKYTSSTGKHCLREPDGSIRMGDEVAFLVCEVADTQPRKDLLTRVRDYIVGTEGAVRIVVLVKLERAKPPKRKRKRAADLLVAEPAGKDLPAIARTEYSRGVFWVYNYTLGPSADDPAEFEGTIKCLFEEQEFYPTAPTSSLSLSWADILHPDDIPRDLVDKSLQIPLSILYDLFAPVATPETARPLWRRIAKVRFKSNQAYPGIILSSDPPPEPAEEDKAAVKEDKTYRARKTEVVISEPRVTRARAKSADAAVQEAGGGAV